MRRKTPVTVVVSLIVLSGVVSPARAQPANNATSPPISNSVTKVPWPAGLPVYDHVVIVIEENKNYEQIIGNKGASYINKTLRAEGANLTQMYAEEHHSEGNYFWLFSGSNQDVGFEDDIPTTFFATSNLGAGLMQNQRSFKGYSEDLPKIGWTGNHSGGYARKHVPWISFSNVPDGAQIGTSSNLRFKDFPIDFTKLPTVAIVVPNLVNDMHGVLPFQPASVKKGDKWLRQNIDPYYRWAKQNNSLLIVTFDEDDNGPSGLTNPSDPDPARRNRIATILAGARIKSGDYAEGKGVTHVNLLRTLEAMYGLPRSGAQQANAVNAGIADDFIITDVFSSTP